MLVPTNKIMWSEAIVQLQMDLRAWLGQNIEDEEMYVEFPFKKCCKDIDEHTLDVLSECCIDPYGDDVFKMYLSHMTHCCDMLVNVDRNMAPSLLLDIYMGYLSTKKLMALLEFANSICYEYGFSLSVNIMNSKRWHVSNRRNGHEPYTKWLPCQYKRKMKN